MLGTGPNAWHRLGPIKGVVNHHSLLPPPPSTSVPCYPAVMQQQEGGRVALSTLTSCLISVVHSHASAQEREGMG